MELTKQCLREVMEHERRCAKSWPRVAAGAGTQTRTLIESLDGVPARPPVPEAVARLIQEVEDEFRGRGVVFAETRAESRPTSAAKASTRPAEPLLENVHARMAAAIRGERWEPLPAGIHRQLAEAITGFGPAPAPVPDGTHVKLMEAVTGREHDELPAGIHARFAAAIRG